eukprot:jgi/Tetstr1/433991/TSEL_023165.t1
MRDYERRVFEATVASSAKATATSRVGGLQLQVAGVGEGRGGGRGRGREAKSLQPYLSAINTFFELHNLVPIAKDSPTPHFGKTLRKGAASAANAIGAPLSHIRYQGGWATNSDVVLDYIDPNVLPSPGAWFFFGHIAPSATSKSNKTPQRWPSQCPPS